MPAVFEQAQRRQHVEPIVGDARAVGPHDLRAGVPVPGLIDVEKEHRYPATGRYT
jgi:hypothetical protein